jgi:hypothetical protein
MSEKNEDIQNRLSKLLSDQSFADFHPFLQLLQQWFSAKAYSPEIFEACVEIFQQMNGVVQSGQSVSDALRQASEGGFVQPGWTADTVNQSGRDIIQNIFNVFRDKVDIDSPRPIEIPIVLLTMNEIEVAELLSLSAFDGYPAKFKKDFVKLKKCLDKEIPAWPSHYKNTFELWQPFNNVKNAIGIKSVVIQALEIAQNEHEQKTLFQASFQDIHGVIRDRSFLKKLRRDGCVVIMDIISMAHPAIFKSFQRSLLDAYPETHVLIFAPTYSIIEEVRNLTVGFEFCMSELEFVQRRYEHGEGYRCKEVFEESDFRHWLNGRFDERTGILQYLNNFSSSDRGKA